MSLKSLHSLICKPISLWTVNVQKHTHILNLTHLYCAFLPCLLRLLSSVLSVPSSKVIGTTCPHELWHLTQQFAYRKRTSSVNVAWSLQLNSFVRCTEVRKANVWMIYKINSFLFLYFLKIFHSLAVQSKPCICTVLPLRYGKTLSW